jgi:hypothetical protein
MIEACAPEIPGVEPALAYVPSHRPSLEDLRSDPSFVAEVERQILFTRVVQSRDEDCVAAMIGEAHTTGRDKEAAAFAAHYGATHNGSSDRRHREVAATGCTAIMDGYASTLSPDDLNSFWGWRSAYATSALARDTDLEVVAGAMTNRSDTGVPNLTDLTDTMAALARSGVVLTGDDKGGMQVRVSGTSNCLVRIVRQDGTMAVVSAFPAKEGGPQDAYHELSAEPLVLIVENPLYGSASGIMRVIRKAREAGRSFFNGSASEQAVALTKATSHIIGHLVLAPRESIPAGV